MSLASQRRGGGPGPCRGVAPFASGADAAPPPHGESGLGHEEGVGTRQSGTGAAYMTAGNSTRHPAPTAASGTRTKQTVSHVRRAANRLPPPVQAAAPLASGWYFRLAEWRGGSCAQREVGEVKMAALAVRGGRLCCGWVPGERAGRCSLPFAMRLCGVFRLPYRAAADGVVSLLCSLDAGEALSSSAPASGGRV